MLTFEPFKKEHLSVLSDPEAAILHATASVVELERHPSFTGRDVEGRIVGCAGLHPIWWPGRWNAWAFLEDATGPHMLQITRFVRLVMDSYPVPRVEAHVVADFTKGYRFAELLGFKLETPEPMLKWLPDGRSVYQFSKVR